MSPKQLAAALPGLLDANVPCIIWGPPGIGKSRIIHQLATGRQWPVVDIRAVLLDPVDLRGLPVPDKENNTSRWLPPEFLPNNEDWEGLLFLDEIAQAPQLVQNSLMQLVLDRRVGEYTLPEGARIVAASNRQEDRAGAHQIQAALRNRFIHLDLEVNFEEWMEWAIHSGIATPIRSFLNFKQMLLCKFDPNSPDKAFPTPRSWEFVSKVFSHTPDDLRQSIFAGCVGMGTAVEFMAFIKLYDQLPNVDKILKDPEGAPVPTETAVVCALIGALSDRAVKLKKDKKIKDIAPMLKYANRLAAEYSVKLMREVAMLVPEVVNLPDADKFFARMQKYLPKAA